MVYDAPDGQWAAAPAFPSGGAGLVSTLDDMHAFGRMLLAGGRLPDGSRLLSQATVEAMTTDQIGAGQGAPGPSPDGAQGWGFGVGVQFGKFDELLCAHAGRTEAPAREEVAGSQSAVAEVNRRLTRPNWAGECVYTYGDGAPAIG